MSIPVEQKSFTFTWILENISYCWQKECEFLRSPTFVIREPQELKFSLSFSPRGLKNNNYIEPFYLKRKDYSSVRIDCELELLSKDGSVLTSMKKKNCFDMVGFADLTEMKENFFVNRSAYFPDNQLTVRCRIWKSEGELTEDVQCFARTRIIIKREAFVWNIRKFGSVPSKEKRTYQIKSMSDNEILMSLNLLLKNPYTDEDSTSIQLVAENGKIKYFEFHLIPLNELDKANKSIRKIFFFSTSEKEKFLILPFPKHDLITNENLCLPNDIISFRCECTYSTGEISEEIESIVYDCDDFATSEPDNHHMDEENTLLLSKRILNENLKSMFQDNILSDVKLKASSKTFLAHKNILSARSPVFKAMFENNMKETFNACVDIEDLDSDTVYRMLQYVYTAEIKDLQWKNACELYRAADKYEIIALRNECSAYLKSNFCLSNACEVLILADTHQDADLKTSAQNFIFDHDIMNSDEWKQLMETHLKLASDTMYLQIQRKLSDNKLTSITPGFGTNTAEKSIASSQLNLSQHQSSNNFSLTPMLNFGAVPTHPGPFMFSNSKDSQSSAPRSIRKAIRIVPRKD